MLYDYPCKMAAYQGRLELDTSSTYSRYALAQEGMIDKMKKGLDSDAVITFLCAENAFHTKYHYGAIEGLNCLEGKNIAVIGLPNISLMWCTFSMVWRLECGQRRIPCSP